MPKIKGGYVLQPRIFDSSNASNMPPVARELWFYLLRNVNHADNGKFKRGQGFFCFTDIREALCWYVGYRKMRYSKTQLTKAQRRLCEDNMTTTTKATRGIIVTICNYEFYQDPKNYEDTNEDITKTLRRHSQGNTINKNDKNERMKEVKKKIKKKSFSPPTQDEVRIYFLENGFSESAGSKAWNYYQIANWTDVKGNQVQNWKQKMIGTWFKDENKINGAVNVRQPNRIITRSERNAQACIDFINEE